MKSFAPGFVEILGNHADDNEGCVLSAAIPMGVITTGRARSDSRVVFSRAATHDSANVEIQIAAAGTVDNAIAAKDTRHAGNRARFYPCTIADGARILSYDA